MYLVILFVIYINLLLLIKGIYFVDVFVHGKDEIKIFLWSIEVKQGVDFDPPATGAGSGAGVSGLTQTLR